MKISLFYLLQMVLIIGALSSCNIQSTQPTEATPTADWTKSNYLHITYWDANLSRGGDTTYNMNDYLWSVHASSSNLNIYLGSLFGLSGYFFDLWNAPRQTGRKYLDDAFGYWGVGLDGNDFINGSVTITDVTPHSESGTFDCYTFLVEKTKGESYARGSFSVTF